MDVTTLGVAGASVTVVITTLAWIIRAVAKGDLIPKSTHEARLADRDARIRDLLDANSVSAKQTESLTVVAEQQVRVMASIEALAKERQ